MTSKIITISGKGMDIVERLLDGMESRGLIELFGLKFSGVTLETGVHAAEPFALMTAQEVAAVQPAPWSGDGLPPVGARCEVLNTDLSNAEWEQCTILFSGKHRIVYDLESCSEFVGYRDCLQFRLIKTPAKIAEEERDSAIRAIDELISSYMGHMNVCELATAIHDAGYRLTKGDDK